MHDFLLSPLILNRQESEDPSCLLCLGGALLKHILSGCKVNLSQGRFSWRTNKVLKCLAAANK